MDGEMRNLAMVWSVAVASLHYCHYIGGILPNGRARFLAILPVIFLFLLLPLPLFSITLGGPTTFFLVWLSNFKLLLFSFGQGPLSPSLPKPLFISTALLPIKITNPSSSKHPHYKSTLNLAVKTIVLSTFFPVYTNKHFLDVKLVMLLYSIYLYISLEMVLGIVAILARTLVGLELEPQFDEPYLATSLQDFWGRRWNLMVSNILRLTVYRPMKSNFDRWIQSKWAPLPAILATFLVSGVMHELIFYYIGRSKPTWELTCFFVLHGAFMCVEVSVKNGFLLEGTKRRLPVVVTRVLTLGFVAATGLWLFMPSVLRCQIDDKARREFVAAGDFFRAVCAKILPLLVIANN